MTGSTKFILCKDYQKGNLLKYLGKKKSGVSANFLRITLFQYFRKESCSLAMFSTFYVCHYMHSSRSFRTLKLAAGQILQPFFKSRFFVWGPTLLKLFQESETALLASDREVKCTCVNSNWQKPESNYLLRYFYCSHFDHVPFVMVSFIVFWFVLVYIYLFLISLFTKSSNLSL